MNYRTDAVNFNNGISNQTCLGDITLAHCSFQKFSLDFYTGIYSGLIGIYMVMAFSRHILLLSFAMTAARNMHNKMFKYVIGATLNFFDRVPVGW